MTSTLAIVRARLPYIDRRTLSEAWFSALHLARQRDVVCARRRRMAEPLVLRRRDIASPGTADSFHPWNSCRLGNCFVAPASGLRSAQAPGSATSRRLAQALPAVPSRIARHANGACASFGIALDRGGRVQILLRREGRVLHVVALCSARHVELVRRALACADLHLRLSGERISSSVRVR